MLINKWLVIDSFNSKAHGDWNGGFCLDLDYEPAELSDLHKELQKLPAEILFTIILTVKNLESPKTGEAYIQNIITFFFQPSYYLVNGRAVVFVRDNEADSLFIEKLSEKCAKQGLHILILNTKSIAMFKNAEGQFAYTVTSAEIDLDALIKDWLSRLLDNKSTGEIHFLFDKNDPALPDILTALKEREMMLFKTQHYKFANIAYRQQVLIDQYKAELDIKRSAEENVQNYLVMQKKQTAENVEWYHHEYEILPTWYKRVGHVIKVFMGKRTLRSLFSDKVKKYND